MKQVHKIKTFDFTLPVAAASTDDNFPQDASNGEIVGVSASGDVTDAEYDQMLITISQGDYKPLERAALRHLKITDQRNVFPLNGLKRGESVTVEVESNVASINAETLFLQFHYHQPDRQ